MSNSSICSIDRTLSGVCSPSQNRQGSNGNEEILCFSQHSSITGHLRFDCLVSYPGHSLGWGLFIQLQRYSRCSSCWKGKLLVTLGYGRQLYLFIIGLMSRVFSGSLGDQGSIPGRVIPETQKTVLDAAFLNTQHHKVMIKGKVEQSREWCSALPNTSV